MLRGVPPQELRELAERMWHPSSLVAALHSLSLPCLQLVEAAQLLGDGCTVAELAQLLAGDGPHDHANEEDVAAVIHELTEYAIVIPDKAGQLLIPDAVSEFITSPLGLGSPLRILLAGLTVDAMRRIQVGLGLERSTNRAGVIASLVTHFSSQDAILTTLATAPGEVLAYLVQLVSDPDHDERSFYDAAQYRRRQTAVKWATERGILIGSAYGYELDVPAEVSRALSGPGFRAPFTPRYPQPAIWPVDRARVKGDAAAAATRFADQALASLDRVARTPVPALKSGGIGVRELTKLAKSIGAEVFEVRLALELADECGLLEHEERHVGASDTFSTWRGSDPGPRFAALLTAWWAIGRAPTEDRDEQGKALPAVSREGYCESCRAGRVALIETIEGCDGASDRASFSRATLWKRPLVHVLADDSGDPFARGWREAETLGVISQGACTELGSALHAGDLETLRSLAAEWLPQSADKARFGGDLTAFVVGAPSGRVSALLDSAADRESHGTASSWRFSPASVRRAMDEGATADGLRAALASIAVGEIPQTLEYLIEDVARRHGSLRLTSTISCIRSDDEALLAEVAVDRRLAKYGLRLLAPTVLATDLPVEPLLQVLRKVGYFPMPDDLEESGSSSSGEDANIVDISAWRRRSMDEEPDGYDSAPSLGPASPAELAGPARLIRLAEPADPVAVASRLLRPGPAVTALASATEQALRALSKSLSGAEVRLLAHAIDSQVPVGIEYQSATGKRTIRVINRPELCGGSVFAWCELRSDNREFNVARIRSVTAV